MMGTTMGTIRFAIHGDPDRYRTAIGNARTRSKIAKGLAIPVTMVSTKNRTVDEQLIRRLKLTIDPRENKNIQTHMKLKRYKFLILIDDVNEKLDLEAIGIPTTHIGSSVVPPSPDYIPGPEGPPSPDYVPVPEEPEQAPPSPVYLPYVPEPVVSGVYTTLGDYVFQPRSSHSNVANPHLLQRSPGYNSRV
ncbi:hypothetical protein Tco_0973750 [Tanacetum coccineum]|uniref:Uncharacterized protein n=1 Tax=Tanacetum coccineum TaxID=301880 RepID=A0ABQ5E9M9_9ASTR